MMIDKWEHNLAKDYMYWINSFSTKRLIFATHTRRRNNLNTASPPSIDKEDFRFLKSGLGWDGIVPSFDIEGMSIERKKT